MVDSPKKLVVHYKGHSALDITDPESRKSVYQAKLTTSKPQISLYRVSADDDDHATNSGSDDLSAKLPARSTATFSLISTKVKLRVREKNILLYKDNPFVCTYKYIGADGMIYCWKLDNIITGAYSFYQLGPPTSNGPTSSSNNEAHLEDSSPSTQTNGFLSTTTPILNSSSSSSPPPSTPLNTNTINNKTRDKAPPKKLIAKYHNAIFSIKDVGRIEILLKSSINDTQMDEMMMSILGVLVMIQSLRLSSRVVFGL
ncbi:hypothetical protein UCRPC4_g00664 [Phaeomoniella chlamydospora]|uniref:Uncharacterized protein n=1 Tax=Phaeomoniella chlamydospora TaxID=158046 RepID=A0A0G2F171_PHACM|nr:hypothetical protein UCRPC4_g00664 [Phaeomoniella chlamydospora]